MISIQPIFLLVMAAVLLIFLGVVWLWLGHRLPGCLLGR